MKKQSGAALIVSLVILVIMTIIGLAAIRNSTMQERMASNIIDRQFAFQAAESALRAGENTLSQLDEEPIANASPSASDTLKIWTEDGSIDPDHTNTLNWWHEPNRNRAWWTTFGEPLAGIKFSTDAGEFTLPAPPRYVIEYIDFVKDDVSLGTGSQSQSGRAYYRITVLGTGASEQSRVMLQSTTAKRY